MNAVTWIGIETQWVQYGKQALRFIAVAAGVLSREIYETVSQSGEYHLNGASLILALAGALVTLPALHQALEQRKQTPYWLELLVAFQYGFFWRVIVCPEVL